MGIKTRLWGFINEVSKKGVQPLRLVQELEKAMEAAKKVLPRRTFVPDRYRVRISARDFEARRDLFEELRHQIERSLEKKVQERGYHLLTPGVSITIEGVEGLARDEIEIQGDYTDPGGHASPELPRPSLLKLLVKGWYLKESGELKAALEEGSGLPQESVSFDPQTPCFTLSLPEGSAVGIGRKMEIETLDSKNKFIGKRHAELRRQENHYFLKDLGSLNGTWVNGEKIQETGEEKRLKDGDQVEIGGRGYLIFEVKLE